MAKSKAVQVDGIFTRDDYNALRKARADLNDLLGKFDRAQACGVDCAMYQQMRADLDAQLAAIELHFMNPVPNK